MRRATPGLGVVFALLAAGVLGACGDDDVRPSLDAARVDAGPVDAAGLDAARVDSGAVDAARPDAAGIDAAAPPDGGGGPTVLAEAVCVGDETSGHVAVSPDGARVAYVTCEPAGGHVWTMSLPAGAPVELGPGDAATTVEFSPDGMHVVFGSAGAFFVRAADGSAAAVRLTTGTIEEHRFIRREDRTTPGVFHTTLLARALDGADRRIVSRSADDGYAGEVVIASDPAADLTGNLTLVSTNGQKLVFERFTFLQYHEVPTDLVAAPSFLPWSSTTTQMLADGLTDVDGIGFEGDRLVFRTFDGSVDVDLAAAVLPSHEPFVHGGFVYFVADGDPTRRERSATAAPAQVLATATAIDMVPVPDRSRAVCLSAGTIFSVATDASGPPVQIIATAGAVTRLVGAFSPDSTQMLALVGDGLRRTDVAVAGTEVLVDDVSVSASSIGFNGAGTRAVWRKADVLRGASAGGSPATLTTGVTGWWSVPRASGILYLTATGQLVADAG